MSWDQELVKENAKLKAKIATLRKQLQDKESAQGQTKQITLSPRKEATQVHTQRKEQIEWPHNFEEPPTVPDVPIGHNTVDP